MLSHKLDRIDLRILVELQKNGRMSKVDLADAVALSPSPCLARVSRLERCGYISGYNARVNMKLLGQTTTIFTRVTLSNHYAQTFANFEKTISTLDEVIEVHRLSGDYDYLLKFITRNTDHYQSLMDEILEGNLGIERYSTYVVLKSPVEKSYYPIDKLFTLEASEAGTEALKNELIKIGAYSTP